MRKLILLVLIAILVGCATNPMPVPKPAPMCDMTVAGKCREMTAGETAGAGVRGHGEDIKDEK